MAKKNISSLMMVFAVVLFGAGLRFQDINWDGGHHLQPDERYISLVLSALKPPDENKISASANGFFLLVRLYLNTPKVFILKFAPLIFLLV